MRRRMRESHAVGGLHAAGPAAIHGPSDRVSPTSINGDGSRTGRTLRIERKCRLSESTAVSRARASCFARGGGTTGCSLRTRCLSRRRRARRSTATSCARVRLSRQRLSRCRAMSFAAQCALGRSRSRRRYPSRSFSSFREISLGLLLRASRRGALLRRGELDARATCLGESDCDCLLRGSRAMLALANVIHLFANELARLR